MQAIYPTSLKFPPLPFQHKHKHQRQKPSPPPPKTLLILKIQNSFPFPTFSPQIFSPLPHFSRLGLPTGNFGLFRAFSGTTAYMPPHHDQPQRAKKAKEGMPTFPQKDFSIFKVFR